MALKVDLMDLLETLAASELDGVRREILETAVGELDQMESSILLMLSLFTYYEKVHRNQAEAKQEGEGKGESLQKAFTNAAIISIVMSKHNIKPEQIEQINNEEELSSFRLRLLGMAGISPDILDEPLSNQ